MTSTPFLDRPMRSISITLDDATLDLLDLVRATNPESPSRSRMIRVLVTLALALLTDETAQDAFLAHLVDEAMPETAATACSVD